MSCEKPKTAREGAQLLMRYIPGMGLGTALCYAEILLGRDPVEPLYANCRCAATPQEAFRERLAPTPGVMRTRNERGEPMRPSDQIRDLKSGLMTETEAKLQQRVGDNPGPYTRAILAWLDAQAEQAANAKVAEGCKQDAQRTADTRATPKQRSAMITRTIELLHCDYSFACMIVNSLLEAQRKHA